MTLLADILIALIALLHVYIAWFEAFAWTTRGPKVFSGFDRDLFPKTITLAQNQGVYNAFLAIGLFWSLLIEDPLWADRIALCFLLFVMVAGIVGAVTASKRILYVQTIPAALAALLVVLF